LIGLRNTRTSKKLVYINGNDTHSVTKILQFRLYAGVALEKAIIDSHPLADMLVRLWC
jgi:hypothetical protein